MIKLITSFALSCPNLTASSICFSDKPDASDSTIKTASAVPATTSSRLELTICSLVGFNIKFPSIIPTFAAATGPIKGIPDIAKAAELAINAKTSGSLSLS